MQQRILIKRTTTKDKDFKTLVSLLDYELWVELEEDQDTYEKFNQVPNIETAVVVYTQDSAIACGCFKEIDEKTIEIKRMFVHKSWRGKGLSKLVLKALEQWAKEKGYSFSILETSIHFTIAIHLYKNAGYSVIPQLPTLCWPCRKCMHEKESIALKLLLLSFRICPFVLSKYTGF